MKKPSTVTPAAAEAERPGQLPSPASPVMWHDTKEVRRSPRHSAVWIGMPTPRRQRSRTRFKRASSSTAEQLTRATSVLAEQHPVGAIVRVRKRVQRLTPTRQTAVRRFLHAVLYAFLHAVLPTRRGQPRGRPAADTPSGETTASAGSTAALPAVLVVDAEPAHRRLLCEILTLEGRTVYLAEHGGPALQQLRASAEGMVVLLDLMMPQVDGMAVLEAVAADEGLARRHTFVIVTAAPLGRVPELRGLPDVPLVAKPFTVNEILRAVDEATGRLTSGPPVRD